MGEEVKTAIKENVWRYFGAMFLEARNNGVEAVSMGRVAFIALLAQAMWIWSGTSSQVDLPPNMMIVLETLLTYVLGSKIIDVIKK